MTSEDPHAATLPVIEPRAAPEEHMSGQQGRPSGTLSRIKGKPRSVAGQDGKPTAVLAITGHPLRVRDLDGKDGRPKAELERIKGYPRNPKGSQRSGTGSMTFNPSPHPSPPYPVLLYRRAIVHSQPPNDRPRGWEIRWLPECEGLAHPKLGPKGGVCQVDNKAILTDAEEEWSRPHIEQGLPR